MPDFQKLKNSITDVMEEYQLKLGYQKETVRLYYPLESLNHLLGTSAEKEEMRTLLKQFREYAKELGSLRFSDREKRFCIVVPPEGAEYVRQTVPQNTFLKGLIQLVSAHGCTLGQVCDYFRTFSGQTVIRKMSEEFDLLLYFPDGKPDSYRYCLRQEGDHVVYHRFTDADYQELGIHNFLYENSNY